MSDGSGKSLQDFKWLSQILGFVAIGLVLIVPLTRYIFFNVSGDELSSRRGCSRARGCPSTRYA